MKRKLLPLGLLFFLLLSPLLALESNREKQLETIIGRIEKEYVRSIPESELVKAAQAGINTVFKAAGLTPESEASPTQLQNDLPALADFYRQALLFAPQIPEENIYLGAVKGVLAYLKDPYTVYFSPQEYLSMMEHMQSKSYAGIGVIIHRAEKGQQLEVLEILSGSPADLAGMKAGDWILKIDGASTGRMDMGTAQQKIRGEENSRIVLNLKRGIKGKPFNLSLTRKILKVKSLSYKIINRDIGYLQLRFFGEETGKELEVALADLDKKGVVAYILDLRNNGGGYINASVDALSCFLPTASKVTTVVARNQPQEVYYSHPNFDARKPVIIWINHYSASASEITTAALREDRGAKVLGSGSFGKASVQKIMALPDGSAFKMTVAHYLTPAGNDIERVGIKPDLLLNREAELLKESFKILAQMTKLAEPEVSTLAEAIQKGENRLPDKNYYLENTRILKVNDIIKEKLVFKSRGKPGEKVFIFERE